MRIRKGWRKVGIPPTDNGLDRMVGTDRGKDLTCAKCGDRMGKGWGTGRPE